MDEGAERLQGIRAVAREAGVSTSTVSRALNGYTDVSAETRARIVSVAEALGYRPSHAAATLRRNATRTVTFMVSKPWTKFVDPYFLGVLDGLEMALSAKGYDLQVTLAREFDRELDTIRRIVASGRSDGVIFGRTRPSDERIDWLKAEGVPFLTVGRDALGDHDWIDRDQAAIGRQAVERLLSLGHRRIALLSAPLRYTYATLTRDGYLSRLAEAGIDPDPALQVECYLSHSTGAEAVGHLFSTGADPTALVCGNDMIAMSAMEGLRGLGLAPGRDVAVIGSDDMPQASLITPALTTFGQNLEAMGLRLGRMMLMKLDGQLGPFREIVESRLIVRESDCPVPSGTEARTWA